MSALQDSLFISANIEKLQGSFVLRAGQWYSDLLNWICVHEFTQDLHTKIENLLAVANVEPTVKYVGVYVRRVGTTGGVQFQK
jgi:hypothetical protein